MCLCSSLLCSPFPRALRHRVRIHILQSVFMVAILSVMAVVIFAKDFKDYTRIGFYFILVGYLRLNTLMRSNLTISLVHPLAAYSGSPLTPSFLEKKSRRRAQLPLAASRILGPMGRRILDHVLLGQARHR